MTKGQLSTVIGIIDGTGAVGAALQQLLVRSISDGFGWKAVFLWLCLCLFCAAALLSPLCVREMRMLIRAVRSGAKETPAPDGYGGPEPSVELAAVGAEGSPGDV